MKKVHLAYLLFYFAFAKAGTAQTTTPECLFVIAKSGLKLRSEPSIESSVITIIPYSAQVLKLSDSVSIRAEIEENSKKIVGNWVKVKTFFHNSSEEYGDIGYVFDSFLGSHIENIPDHSLHNFTEIHDRSSHASMEIEGVDRASNLYQRGQNCEVRYEYNPQAKKVLEGIIQFTKINPSLDKFKRLKTDYNLDTSLNPKRFPLENQTAAREGYTQYYLPINGGKDSTLVKDDAGEWASVTAYLGYIKKIDSYFVTGFAEDQEIVRISQKDGVRSRFSNGSFSISPHGNYLVSFTEEIFNELTRFSIRYLDKIDSGFEITFTSWMPSGTVEWINNKEFILPVVPMDQRYYKSKKPKVTYLLGQIMI